MFVSSLFILVSIKALTSLFFGRENLKVGSPIVLGKSVFLTSTPLFTCFNLINRYIEMPCT